MKTSNKTGVKIVGWIGTILLISGYALNSLSILESTGVIYASINLLAAIFLGIRVGFDKNWSNLVLNFFWAGIALINIIKFLLHL